MFVTTQGEDEGGAACSLPRNVSLSLAGSTATPASLVGYLYYSNVICVLTSFLCLPHNFFLYIYEHANKIAAS